MIKFLRQPYPFFHQGNNLIRITLSLIIVGFLFEYFLVPFERTPEEHLYSYAIISLAHVSVATLLYFLYFLILSQIINDEDWKIYKELVAMFFLLFLIGIGEWMIRDLIYDNPWNWTWPIFVEEVWHAYLAGTVIIALVLSLNFNLLYRKNDQHAMQIERKLLETERAGNKRVRIQTQTTSDDFEMDPNSLLCARSDGNYVEFYIRNEQGVQKLIKRITLQSALEQLADFRFILRTHRAFLVNMVNVTGVKGNAQGYQLNVGELDFQVPVSRKHMDGFNQAMA